MINRHIRKVFFVFVTCLFFLGQLGACKKLQNADDVNPSTIVSTEPTDTTTSATVHTKSKMVSLYLKKN